MTVALTIEGNYRGADRWTNTPVLFGNIAEAMFRIRLVQLLGMRWWK
jgi:hypothetical protein